jgi:hypothetical protein
VARRYGGLKVDQARRLKDLERENQRLKKAVSELTLDKLIASNVDTCTGCHLWRPAGVLMPRNCKGAGNGTWFLIPLACMSPIDRRRGIEAQKSTDLRVEKATCLLRQLGKKVIVAPILTQPAICRTLKFNPPLVIFVCLLVLMPASAGDLPDAYSFAMSYNRWLESAQHPGAYRVSAAERSRQRRLD